MVHLTSCDAGPHVESALCAHAPGPIVPHQPPEKSVVSCTDSVGIVKVKVGQGRNIDSVYKSVVNGSCYPFIEGMDSLHHHNGPFLHFHRNGTEGGDMGIEVIGRKIDFLSFGKGLHVGIDQIHIQGFQSLQVRLSVLVQGSHGWRIIVVVKR